MERGSTEGVTDPHVPFKAGAIPVCSSDAPLVFTSAGATLFDHHGARESLVAASVVKRMGSQFVTQVAWVRGGCPYPPSKPRPMRGLWGCFYFCQGGAVFFFGDGTLHRGSEAPTLLTMRVSTTT